MHNIMILSFHPIKRKGIIFLDTSITKDESYRFKPVVRQDSYLAACKKPTIIGELYNLHIMLYSRFHLLYIFIYLYYVLLLLIIILYTGRLQFLFFFLIFRTTHDLVIYCVRSIV